MHGSMEAPKLANRITKKFKFKTQIQNEVETNSNLEKRKKRKLITLLIHRTSKYKFKQKLPGIGI